MLLHMHGQFTMVFLSIVSHSIRTHSLISRSTCPLNFLKYNSSFYPHILAHSSRTSPLTFLKHSRSFYPHILAHSSRTCPLTFLKHSRSFNRTYSPILVIHAHSLFSSIAAHSIRTYLPILVIHVLSLFSSILAHSINNISVISWRSVLLVEETAIH